MRHEADHWPREMTTGGPRPLRAHGPWDWRAERRTPNLAGDTDTAMRCWRLSLFDEWAESDTRIVPAFRFLLSALRVHLALGKMHNLRP